jgi:hypothetical protein
LVITQEWIAEAMAMWFIAAVVVIAAASGNPCQALADWVYRASAIMLLAVAVLTATTGARTAVVFFKICPVLLSATRRSGSPPAGSECAKAIEPLWIVG